MLAKSFILIMTVSMSIGLCGCKKPETKFYNAGLAYLENAQYPEAEENFLLSLEKEEENKNVLRALGIACIYNEKYSEAAEYLVRALQKSNGGIREIDYDINDYLGYAYTMAGDYENAIEVYNALITLQPKKTENYFNRARVLLFAGDKSGAEKDFNVVTSKDPQNMDLHLNIFFTMRDAGYELDARSYILSVVENSKKITDYDLGRVNYYLGDYSNARVYLEKAKDMSDTDTILMLGKTYEAIGDYAYAATLYNSYLNAKGNNAAVYNQLGACRMQTGDYAGAITAFSFGLKLNDKKYEQELLFNEAVAYEYSLDFETAKEKMKEYVSLYPKDSKAVHELVFLNTR